MLKIAIILCGANDYVKNVELGKIDDTIEDTFYGALDILFSKAKKRYKKIIILTSISHKTKDIPNKKGYVMNDYSNAVVKQAEKHGLFVIRGENAPMFISDEQFCKENMFDAVHLNSSGHKILFDYIVSQIKKASVL